MTDGAAVLRTRLRLLAVELVAADARPGATVPDVAAAIALATDLIVAGQDAPGTVEVAVLDHSSSFEEARPALVSMLFGQGLDLTRSPEDPHDVRLAAFVDGLISVEELEGLLYDRLAERGTQSLLHSRLARLFHERDAATGTLARNDAEARMADVVRHHVQQLDAPGDPTSGAS